ncbi:9096_t:CDS:2, partial [Cetraspora pellucida]
MDETEFVIAPKIQKVLAVKNKVVTKYTFARILESAFAATYIPKAIKNAFRTTEILLFNPNAI